MYVWQVWHVKAHLRKVGWVTASLL